jgi:hypothetical protein
MKRIVLIISILTSILTVSCSNNQIDQSEINTQENISKEESFHEVSADLDLLVNNYQYPRQSSASIGVEAVSELFSNNLIRQTKVALIVNNEDEYTL